MSVLENSGSSPIGSATKAHLSLKDISTRIQKHSDCLPEGLRSISMDSLSFH